MVPPSVESLIVTLKDNNSNVRRFATEALGEIGDPRAIEPLVTALQDEDSEVRGAAAEALDKLGWKPESKEMEAIYLIAKQEWERCVEIGAPAVEPLIAALKDKNELVRKAAAEALGKIGDPQAVEPLIDVFKEIEGYTGEAEIEALVKIGAPAVEPLIAALKAEDSRVRWGAARALGKIGESRAVEALIATLRDKNGFVRRAAAEALGEIGDVRAVEPLIDVLKYDLYDDVRKAAAEALHQLGWEGFKEHSHAT